MPPKMSPKMSPKKSPKMSPEMSPETEMYCAQCKAKWRNYLPYAAAGSLLGLPVWWYTRNRSRQPQEEIWKDSEPFMGGRSPMDAGAANIVNSILTPEQKKLLKKERKKKLKRLEAELQNEENKLQFLESQEIQPVDIDIHTIEVKNKIEKLKKKIQKILLKLQDLAHSEEIDALWANNLFEDNF